MGQPVMHFEICGPDSDKLRAFYDDLFGWRTTTHEASGYRMVDTQSDGRGIAGGIAAPPDGAARVTVYVEVPDVKEALARAEGLGATTLLPEMAVPDGPTIGMFNDPAGNVSGVVKTA